MDEGYFGNIVEQDAPIHRFVRLRHFSQFLQGELVLVRPTTWDDPFELLAHKSMITDKRQSPWRQYPIATVMGNVFGQSWSLNDDSDTYLRAYSSVRKDSTGRNADREFESVRITTTPKKLQSAVEGALKSSSHSGEVFVFTCGVKYIDGEAIKSAVASAVNRTANTARDRAKTTADLCLLKRLSFQYEREVRSLVMFSDPEPSAALLPLKIDPGFLVDAISFDPRLAKGERLERAELLRGSGLEGRVFDGEQYQGVLLEIIVE